MLGNVRKWKTTKDKREEERRRGRGKVKEKIILNVRKGRKVERNTG